MARTSKYLEAKAHTLRSALLFFMDRDKDERLMSFLDQIDFWDWEVDELLFSFNNFADRAKSFETTEPSQRAASFGLMVNPKKAGNIQSDRRWDRRWDTSKMAAPTDSLGETLMVWHTLLTEAEALLVSDKVLEQAKNAGAVNVTNKLDKYRKTAG